MTHGRRILFASPIEPSGASWLLNCFLELDIRIDHKPAVDRVWRGSAAEPQRMWIAIDEGRVSLNPKAGVLKKFLPALTRRTEFRFRDDVSVQYVQDLPARETDERHRVLMVRDPRDALYSAYRRGTPNLTFEEFLRFPNPLTLLDRAAHWTLFTAAWLSLPGIQTVRFEDYKRDADATLRAVLAALDLTYPDRDIKDAVRFSSFEQARNAELALRNKFPFDSQIANRSGKVGEGRNQLEVLASIRLIEDQAGAMLRALCYEVQAPDRGDAFVAARLSAACLAFLDTVHLPDAVRSVALDMAASEPALFALLSFAHRLDQDLLRRAGLPPAEVRALIDSLQEFARNYAKQMTVSLASTRSTFDDGSNYFFQRIRNMRQSSGAGPPR